MIYSKTIKKNLVLLVNIQKIWEVVSKSLSKKHIKNTIKEIVDRYAIKVKIKAYPRSGNAPLTVTFDGRGSVDPSADTIPTNNYYWYYKDSNGVEKFM